MPTYYPINETLARQANMMNSHYEYKAGSATAEYHAMVDEAAAIAEKQKARTDPMYHERIDRLLDTYARKLADNFNENFEIQTRCPSILVAGRANFPVRKKEKQNAASDRNMEEYRRIRGLLDKIRSTGMGGVSSDDGNAIAKLRENLESREQAQEEMKAVNAYYWKNGTLQGCPILPGWRLECPAAAASHPSLTKASCCPTTRRSAVSVPGLRNWSSVRPPPPRRAGRSTAARWS